jgi:N-acetylated-alpha-linked acidic dipeptidase
MLLEASKSVTAPSGKSLYEAWRATSMRDKESPAPPVDSDLVETRIGSGSDHTVFLNHLGRPVVNLGFTGDYGVYHSAYDDHWWMQNVGDPNFAYHTALTRIWGVVTLRLANSDILPFDFGANGAALRTFLDELGQANKIDPADLKLASLERRIAEFAAAGEQLRDAIFPDLEAGSAAPRQIRRVNAELFRVESNWLNPAGIPGRPWFRHVLYAARYTYAHLEFPGLTEAVEAGNWPLAVAQADAIGAAVTKNTELLQSAAASWRAGQ